MAHADRSACRSAHIFDGIAATGETDIKFSFDKPLENLRIVGARVFAEVSRSGPKYFWSYNIKTRVVSESVTKQSNKNQFYDFKYFAGEYVILGKMHSVAAGKSSTKYEMHVIVFDPTGKEYFSFSAPAQDSVRIEFLVIDGRLFIIAGHQLYVFKSAK